MKSLTRSSLTVLAILALSIPAAATNPPEALHYQGVLRGAADQPLTGAYDMRFRFFDAAVGGEEVVVDEHLATGTGAVQVGGGVFGVQLGGGQIVDGSGVSGNDPYVSLGALFRDFGTVWLEVEVDGGGGFETLSPRIEVVSSAYALNAGALEGKAAAHFIDASTDAQVKEGTLTVAGMGLNGQFLNLPFGAFLADNGTRFTMGAGWEDTDELFLRAGNSFTDGHILIDGDGEFELWSGNGTFKFWGGDGAGFVSATLDPFGNLTIPGQMTIQGGGAAAGMVLTSDASGTASWQAGTPGPQGPPGPPGPEGSQGSVGPPGPTRSPRIGHITTLWRNRAFDTTVVFGHPAVTIGEDGLPVIAFSALDPVAGNVLRVMMCLDIACTSADFLDLATTNDPESIDMTIDAEGFVAIAFTVSQELFLARIDLSPHGGPVATSQSIATGVEPTASLMIATNGLPVLATASVGGNVRLYFCSDPDCTSRTTTDLLSGTNPSITMGGNGYPALLFYNGIDVLYAWCDDENCINIWNVQNLGTMDTPPFPRLSTTTTDGTATYGFYGNVVSSIQSVQSDSCYMDVVEATGVSVAARPDGKSMIAFANAVSSTGVGGPDTRQIVVCADFLSVIDEFPYSGSQIGEPALTIGTDGFPLVVYVDPETNFLKVTHCSNAACIPHFRPR